MIRIMKLFSQRWILVSPSVPRPPSNSRKRASKFWFRVPRVAIIRTTIATAGNETRSSRARAFRVGASEWSWRNINGLLSLCVCCSGSAGESAGRRGSRLGDLAIPAQVTRGPRSRLIRRKRRGQLRHTSPSHTSGGGERCAWWGTPARHRRQQATVGGMDTSEQCSRCDLAGCRVYVPRAALLAELAPRCSQVKKVMMAGSGSRCSKEALCVVRVATSIRTEILKELVEMLEQRWLIWQDGFYCSSLQQRRKY